MAKIYTQLTDLIGHTPMLELTHLENEYNLKARLVAKLEFFNPGGSVKDRAALSMIEDAEKRGVLKEGAVIIEPTSGNTGVGLAWVGKIKGYRTILTMPETMSKERQMLLKALGAELVLTPGTEGMSGAIRKAESLRDETPGAVILQQFENPANPQAHVETTAEEIWEDSEGQVDVFVAGVGTVLADDPLLTCRMEGGRNPVRIICDTHLSTPLDSRILETAREVDTILAIGQKVERERQIPYEEKGCTLLEIPEKEGKIDLSVLMKELGKRQIDSILLEGGGELNWSALQAGIVKKVMAYIAPKLIGGREAKGPVGGQGYPDPQESLFLKPGKISRLGDDYLIESEVDGNVHRNC